jgi:hypothetical protein
VRICTGGKVISRGPQSNRCHLTRVQRCHLTQRRVPGWTGGGALGSRRRRQDRGSIRRLGVIAIGPIREQFFDSRSWSERRWQLRLPSAVRKGVDDPTWNLQEVPRADADRFSTQLVRQFAIMAEATGRRASHARAPTPDNGPDQRAPRPALCHGLRPDQRRHSGRSSGGASRSRVGPRPCPTGLPDPATPSQNRQTSWYPRARSTASRKPALHGQTGCATARFVHSDSREASASPGTGVDRHPDD